MTMEPAVGPELSGGDEVFLSVDDAMTVTGPGPARVTAPVRVGPAISFVRAPKLEVRLEIRLGGCC